jgi:HK97 family phage major capsid protein
MSRKALNEIGGALKHTRTQLDALFAKKTADGRYDWSAEDHDSFKSLNAKAADQHREYTELEALVVAEEGNRKSLDFLGQPANGLPHQGAPANLSFEQIDRARRESLKSFGELVVGSAEFKSRRSPGEGLRIELPNFDFIKTTMTSGAGFAPPNDRGPDVVMYPVRPVRIYDVLPQIPTTDSVIKYMEETTHTANNASVSENNQLAENAYAFTERSVTVEAIGSKLPVSEQQLADVGMIQGLIDQLMTDDQRRAEETQILSGSGSTPQIMGFLNKSGLNTQAKGTDNAPAAILKAMTTVQTTGQAEATAILLNPADWTNIRLLQDANGNFIYGHPSVQGPQTLWGVPVITIQALTAGTALTGAFRPYAYVARRQGAVVEVGLDGNDFSYLRKTIRVFSRLCLVIRRPQAFTKVTGL